jgi:hypothetical protein
MSVDGSYADLEQRVVRQEEQLYSRLKEGEKEWLLDVLARLASPAT